MRRMIAALLAVLLLSAFAALGEASGNYIRYGDTDRVVLELQLQLGIEEDGKTNAPLFGDRTLAALLDWQSANGLEPTGEFDPETLIMLLGVSQYDADNNIIVWIPMHGGIKYHREAKCSNMNEPRQMPLSCADKMGFSYCRKCYR